MVPEAVMVVTPEIELACMFNWPNKDEVDPTDNTPLTVVLPNLVLPETPRVVLLVMPSPGTNAQITIPFDANPNELLVLNHDTLVPASPKVMFVHPAAPTVITLVVAPKTNIMLVPVRLAAARLVSPEPLPVKVPYEVMLLLTKRLSETWKSPFVQA